MICKYKSTKLNSSKYCYVSLTIQIKHQSFVFTQINNKIVLFQTIQLRISHLFALSLNVKQFYLTYRLGPSQVLPLQAKVLWQ